MGSKLALPPKAKRTEEGDVRSVVLTGYFTVPWDYPEPRIPFQTYLERFVRLYEGEGWKFERVLETRRDHVPTFNPDGEGRKTYIMNVLFSRPAKRQVLELPDKLAEALIKQRPDKYGLA